MRKLLALLFLTFFLVNVDAINLSPTNTTRDGTITFIIQDGNIWLQDSNTSIQTGYSGAISGTHYRALLDFNISSVDQNVLDANLNIFYTSKTIINKTCSFDLNSVTTIGAEGLSGRPPNGDDWNSAVFERVINNWFSDTIDANQIGNITTAWNNARAAGRKYLTFRIGMDDEENYSAFSTLDSCTITFGDTSSGNIDIRPYISYTLAPLDLNINNPSASQYFGKSTTTDGNRAIDFNVMSSGSNYLYANIFYSTTKGAFQNLIVSDLNLNALGRNQTTDANCSSSIFSTSQRCFYDFNFMSITPDGNYFIDVNVFYATRDANKAASGTNSFNIDSTKPSTRWDGNSTWQNTDANIHLTCSDGSGSGCSIIRYRLDTDSSSTISLGTWTTFDKNIFLTIDGNYAIDFNSTDNTGNIGDANRFYILVDKTKPTTSWDGNNNTWQNTDANIHLICSDANSGCSSTRYRLDTDSSSTINLGAWTTFDKNIFITIDGNWTIDFNSTDNANNIETTNRIFALVDKTKPSTSWDGNNSIGQNTDANVHLTCSDANSGCSSTRYRLDTDSSSTINLGAWTTFDKNIFITIDGNWAIDFNSTDNANNIETTNRVYVIIDKTGGFVTRFSPDSNTTTVDSTPNFVVYVSDTLTTPATCGYRITFNNSILLRGTVTVISGTCLLTYPTDLTINDVIIPDWNVTDSVGNTSDFNRGFSLQYYIPSGAVLGGGGGGTGAGAGELIDTNGFCIITDNCKAGLECLSNRCTETTFQLGAFVVSPIEINSDPTQDVLPNYKILLPEIFLSNTSDAAFDVNSSFVCSNELNCAKDWCRITSGLSDRTLQPRGTKTVNVECIISADANIGGIYQTQLVFEGGKITRGVSITIPVNKASALSVGAIFFETTKIAGNILNTPAICIGSTTCPLHIPNSTEITIGDVVITGIAVKNILLLFALVALIVFQTAPTVVLFVIMAVLNVI